MAKYVVIEFDSNDEADDFVKRMNRHTKEGFLYRVVGLFVKPFPNCSCPDASHINYGDKNRKQGIRFNRRYGMWVCTRCKRPRAAGHQLTNQLSMLDLYEGPRSNDYEEQVTQLAVTGIHKNHLKGRPKHLKRKKK